MITDGDLMLNEADLELLFGLRSMAAMRQSRTLNVADYMLQSGRWLRDPVGAVDTSVWSVKRWPRRFTVGTARPHPAGKPGLRVEAEPRLQAAPASYQGRQRMDHYQQPDYVAVSLKGLARVQSPEM